MSHMLKHVFGVMVCRIMEQFVVYMRGETQFTCTYNSVRELDKKDAKLNNICVETTIV